MNKIHFTAESALKELETLFEENLQAAPNVLKEISLRLIQSGGKRLRPSLMFLAAEILGPLTKEHLKMAACLELIHTTTLLHDDVIDNSAIRRGLATAHLVWSPNHSILAGDFLLCKSLSLLSEVRNWEAMQKVQDCSNAIIQGQAMELWPQKKTIEQQEAHYLEVIHLKTASLFEAAATLPTCLHPEPSKKKYYPILENFGENLGIYFQLIDDILDYAGTIDSLGKKPGQDFFERKITLPKILAYQHAPEDMKQNINQIDSQAILTENDFSFFQHCLQKTDAFKRSFVYAKTYAEKALQALEILPLHTNKSTLASLIAKTTNKIPVSIRGAD